MDVARAVTEGGEAALDMRARVRYPWVMEMKTVNLYAARKLADSPWLVADSWIREQEMRHTLRVLADEVERLEDLCDEADRLVARAERAEARYNALAEAAREVSARRDDAPWLWNHQDRCSAPALAGALDDLDAALSQPEAID